MKVTVLGKSPAWQDAGGACSGYLVEHSGGLLLVDCGNGVFGKLRAAVGHEAVDAVVITHLHADHLLDLVPYAYALTYGPASTMPKPRLFVPPGGIEALQRLCGLFDSATLVTDAFQTTEYDPLAGLELGALDIGFQHVPHFIDAWALRLIEGEARFVFGADCGPDAELAEFAADADLLLLESTFAHDAPGGLAGHLTPIQAAELARQARAKRLVLTHISDMLDTEASRNAAAEVFDGPVEVAAEGSSWTL